MGLALYIGFVIAACLRPDSKKLTQALIIFMIIIFGFNTDSVDYPNYLYVYQTLPFGISGSYEPLYELLLSVVRMLGFTFTSFRLVIAAISAILIYKAVMELTRYPAIAMAIIVMYPFMHYAVAIRAGVAGAIVLYSIMLLLRSKDHPIRKFVIGIAIATLFHYTSIIYLLCLMVKLPVSNKKILAVGGTFALVVALLVHCTNIPYVVLKALNFSPKVLAWFDPASKTSGILVNLKGVVYICLAVLGNMALCYIAKWATEKYGEQKQSPMYTDVCKAAVTISMILLPILPLMISDVVYLRFLKVIFPITICVCVETLSLIPRRENWREQIKALMVKPPVVMIVLICYVIVVVYMKNKPLIEYTQYSYFEPLFHNILF